MARRAASRTTQIVRALQGSMDSLIHNAYLERRELAWCMAGVVPDGALDVPSGTTPAVPHATPAHVVRDMHHVSNYPSTVEEPVRFGSFGRRPSGPRTKSINKTNPATCYRQPPVGIYIVYSRFSFCNRVHVHSCVTIYLI